MGHNGAWTCQGRTAKRNAVDGLVGYDAKSAICPRVPRVGEKCTELVDASVGGADGAAQLAAVCERQEASLGTHVAVGLATRAPSPASGQKGEDGNVKAEERRQSNVAHARGSNATTRALPH